jgi:putative transposase
MSRGNGKQKVFLCDYDYRDFLAILAEVIEDCGWRCHSYCLMQNHYHLLLETPEGRMPEGMQLLNGIYGGKFNRRHDSVGHVMQGRYKSRRVRDDNHFLILLRYMALNPVKAGVAKDPSDWQWSSYRPLAGLSPAPRFLTHDLVLQFYSLDEHKARESYANYIQGFTAAARAGDLGYCPALEELFGVYDKPSRDRAIVEAYRDYGYRMSEIADYLDVSCSTISRVVKSGC